MSRILTEALIRLELFDKQLLHYNFPAPTHSLSDNTVLQKSDDGSGSSCP